MHPDVEVRLYGPGTAAERMEGFADWRPDGLIVGGNAEENLRAAARIGVRAAVLAETEPPADCPLRLGSVFCDNAAAAREAAALFGERRLAHWAYVGEDRPWSRAREARLRELAERAGRAFHAFLLTDGAAARRTSALGRWLAALPAPCGVLAANDIRARRDRRPVRLQERRLPQAALPRPPRLHHARLAPPRPRPVTGGAALARRYGISTFTRKNRVDSFVGPQDRLTRLVFPSTV